MTSTIFASSPRYTPKIVLMRFILVCLTFYFFTFPAFGQKKEKSWDAATLAKANTAKNEAYLTEEEKEVIFYINLVRLNPKLFLETYVKKYLEETEEKDTYTKSLQKALSSTKAMDALKPAKDLFGVAKAHAIDFGKAGKTGHGNYDLRIKKIRNNYHGSMGENCDYGAYTPLTIVMRLLIDENVESLGHRENILDREYKFIGVSIQPHERYQSNCVMDFGG